MEQHTGVEYILRDEQNWWQKRSLATGPDDMWLSTNETGAARRIAPPNDFTHPWLNPAMDNPIMDKATIAAWRAAVLDNPTLMDQVGSEATKQALLDGSILDDGSVEKLHENSLKKRHMPVDQLLAKFTPRLIEPNLFEISSSTVIGSRATSLAGSRAIVYAIVLPQFEGNRIQSGGHEWQKFTPDELDARISRLNPNDSAVAISRLMISLSGINPPQ